MSVSVLEKLSDEERQRRASKNNSELLKTALILSQFEKAQQLVDEGTDVNGEDFQKLKDSILCLTGVTEFLIKNKTKFSNATLEMLLFLKQFDTAQKLIDSGVSLNIESSLFKGGTERFSLIEVHCTLNQKDDFSTAEFLLKNKADINYTLNRPLIHTCFEAEGFNYKRAAFLIKHGADINAYGKQTYTVLLNAICTGNIRLVKFLCENKANVHLPYKNGDFPLLDALRRGCFDIARVLLEYSANIFLLPANILLELQHSKNREARQFFNELMIMYAKKFDKERIETLTLEEIKNTPFHVVALDGVMMAAIERRIETLLRASPLEKTIIERLLIALEHWKEYTSRFNKLHPFNVIAEMAELLQKPELIDQGETNLCGPASLLTTLLKSHPLGLLDLSLELLKSGKTTDPLELDVSKHSKNEAISFASILMTEIRRSGNYTGYSPSSYRETIQGVTGPRVLCQWLENFGYHEIEDLTFMMNPRGTPLIKPLHMLLDIAFCGFHKEGATSLSPHAILERLIFEFNRGTQVILFLSDNFMNILENRAARDPRSHSRSKSICCIPIDHFAYLSQFRIVDDKVKFEIMTFGKKYFQVVCKDEFLEGYRGAILAKAPILKPDPKLQLFQFGRDDDRKLNSEKEKQHQNTNSSTNGISPASASVVPKGSGAADSPHISMETVGPKTPLLQGS